METAVIWFLVFVGLYWLYCIYWGVQGFRRIRTGAGWAIAGRQLPGWLFMLAASATSFSAWTYIGHPGSISASGMAYAFAGLYAITIPFTGVLFIKRQWMLGRRFGFVTPPEQYGAILNSKMIFYLVILIGFLYSTFYVAVQLTGSGLLFSVITGGMLPFFAGAILLALVMWFYVAGGGLRIIAWVDAVQFFLLVGGITMIGIGVLSGLGGWSGLQEKIATLHPYWTDDHGVIVWGKNWVAEVEGIGMKAQWTGLMMFSYMFALAGIQQSPAFTMWSYGLKSIKILPWQTTVGIGVIIGSTLVIWSVIQGLGGQYLATIDPAWTEAGLKELVVGVGAGGGSPRDALVPKMMLEFLPPVLVGLAAVGLLAAAQSTAAPYISSFSAMASRNLVGEYLINKETKRRKLANGGSAEKVHLSQVMTEARQVFMNRTFASLILISAFVTAYFSPAAIVMLGGLAVAYAWQLFVPLLYIIYGVPRWWTGKGIAWGLLAGIIGVSITYVSPEWKYPLAIHSAGWGIFFNLIVTSLVSAISTHSKSELSWRDTIRELFRSHDPDFYTTGAKKWQKFILYYMPFWWLMWVGPGMVLSPLFDGWLFGAPGMWFWLVLGYVTGVFMLWSMAFKAKLAAPPSVTPEPIDEEARKTLTPY